MKRDALFKWDGDCQHAFESIKAYLTKPPVLANPIKGRPLVLYITAPEHYLNPLLAQENDTGKENASYYLSQTLVGLETRYSPVEKLCLALLFSIQKLRHYLQHHHTKLISKADPLTYILRRPTLNGWASQVGGVASIVRYHIRPTKDNKGVSPS